jgi:hypothetical protein
MQEPPPRGIRAQQILIETNSALSTARPENSRFSVDK